MKKAADTKNQALDDAEEYLNKLIDALHEVKSGTPESFVCRKYNINKSAFRRLIFQ